MIIHRDLVTQRGSTKPTKPNVKANIKTLLKRIEEGVSAAHELANSPVMHSAAGMLDEILMEPAPGKRIEALRTDSLDGLHVVDGEDIHAPANTAPLDFLGKLVMHYTMQPDDGRNPDEKIARQDDEQRKTDEQTLERGVEFLREHGIKASLPQTGLGGFVHRHLIIDPAQPGFLKNVENAVVAWKYDKVGGRAKSIAFQRQQLEREIRTEVQKSLWGEELTQKR